MPMLKHRPVQQTNKRIQHKLNFQTIRAHTQFYIVQQFTAHSFYYSQRKSSAILTLVHLTNGKQIEDTYF